MWEDVRSAVEAHQHYSIKSFIKIPESISPGFFIYQIKRLFIGMMFEN